MKIFVNKLCLILWFFISVLDKSFWYIRRSVQYQKLNYCGKNVFIGRYCHLTEGNISIHDDVYIGEGCRFQSIGSKIIIGNHVMFGPNVSIHGGDHRTDLIGKFMKEIDQSEKLPENDQDVIIEDDVWIGSSVIILKGVNIGEGSIIGAGSVVTRNVPPYSILVGTKTQKIFSRWSETDIAKHKLLIENRLSKKSV